MRFVTWNIDGLNDNAIHERTEAAVFTSILGARLDELQSGTAKPKPPPDVLVFQEVVALTYTAHLSTHLRAGGYTVLPTTLPERQTFEVIAVREPFVVKRHVEEPLVDSQYGRVLHIVDLDDGAGNEIRVLTGHFDSGKDSSKVRAAQLSQVAKHLTTGVASVFGGDTNLRKAEWESARNDLGIVDAWEVLGELSSSRVTWQRDEYKARFDRVFTGGAVIAKSMAPLGSSELPGLGTTISDHIGLLVEFTLE